MEMSRKYRIAAFALTLSQMTAFSAYCHAQAAPPGNLPVSIAVYDRTRIDTWKWFAAPPQSETYSYLESLLRIGVAQNLHKWDWQLELAQPSVLGLPDDAISPVTA